MTRQQAAAWRWASAGLLAASVASSTWAAIANLRTAAALRHLQTCIDALEIAAQIKGSP